MVYPRAQALRLDVDKRLDLGLSVNVPRPRFAEATAAVVVYGQLGWACWPHLHTSVNTQMRGTAS